MKSETSVFTVRLPVHIQKKLDSLAESMDRSRSWLVNQAIEDYMRVQEWQMEQIEQAVREADQGDFATEKQMKALWNKYKKPRQ